MTDSQEQRFQSATVQRFDRLEGRFDRVIDDLGPLKGAHAGNAAGKEAALIARDLGLGYRKSLTIIELLNLTDAANTVSSRARCTGINEPWKPCRPSERGPSSSAVGAWPSARSCSG